MLLTHAGDALYTGILRTIHLNTSSWTKMTATLTTISIQVGQCRE